MARQRRLILRSIIGAAIALVVSPFLSWGKYLYRKTDEQLKIRQKVANIVELKQSSKIYFPFPKTGDPKVDSDPFRQYALVITPSGDVKALSRVCVHLWCLWEYIPSLNEAQCPCHGSVYNPDTGVAIRGPAYYQPYPTNALPMLKVEVDENGDIYVSQLDGRVGIGREWKRDLSRIKKLAEDSPDRRIIAYIPLWNPIPSSSIRRLVEGYNLEIVKIYGFIDRGSGREWRVVEKMEDTKRLDAVYALDVAATPNDLLRLAEDKDVIIPLLREASGDTWV